MEIAAHLILGSREEPFLNAMLASLEGVATTLVVNDNSDGDSPHESVLGASGFARRGRLFVDRTPFVDFATARNLCLDLHARQDAGGWVAFIDADEVHGAQAARIAANLDELPADVAFVDGYTWHFFQSFDFYTSIERRMAFFRFSPRARWRGAVHEHLEGIEGRRLALPYVYAHYGHTLQPRRHAEKSRQYSALGAPGNVLREEDLPSFDVAAYFEPVYHRLMRFGGRHPEFAQAPIERLRPILAAPQNLTARMAANQPLWVKVRNLVRKANYELRWRGRVLAPLARRAMEGPGAVRRRKKA
ncbi:MAG: hypothetical protein ACREMP_01095 [Candidatus Tyrphobacter sp.]